MIAILSALSWMLIGGFLCMIIYGALRGGYDSLGDVMVTIGGFSVIIGMVMLVACIAGVIKAEALV